MRHTLKKIFEVNNLKKVWRIIHKGLPEDLVRDPLDYFAYEINLEPNLRQLRYSVLSGSYSPKNASIVRSAKRDGLTRCLSFLEIEDLIVMKTICDSLQPDLHKDFPEYVDFSRRLQTAFPKEKSDYESWFEHWLRHQNRLIQIIAKRNGWKYIVLADISNFFPSINHVILRQTISSKVQTEEKVINLLFFILDSMIPKTDYCSDHSSGLPQENHDVSRILAHAFLQHLDAEFEREGKEGRYARWVDDIVVAVETKGQGRETLGRIQRQVENKGLFLNNSKCRILDGATAIKELWLAENEFLDDIHSKTKQREIIDLPGFEDRLREFLNKKGTENWERVLRRYYTESRRTNSSFLEDFAFNHINDHPSESEYILNYLVARPFRKEILHSCFHLLKNEESCYENVEILIYEFLMNWAIPNKKAIRDFCTDLALNHFFGRHGFSPPKTGYVRGLITLFCYKVSGRPALEEIKEYYEGNNDLTFLKYAFCCLAATADFKDLAFKKATSIEDISLRRLETLFRDLEYNCNKYSKLLKRFLLPRDKTWPTRVIMPTRSLPLVKISRRDRHFHSEWVKLCERAVKRLESPSAEALHDHLSIDFLKSELKSV
jgi:hypothetical protein